MRSGITRADISAAIGNRTRAYLEVTNDATTWVNLGALSVGGNTRNFFNTADLSNSIDSNTLSFSATLKREIALDSLSPFRTDSLVNESEVTPGTYSPLLDLNRQWRIMVAVVDRGTIPVVPDDYREMASGYIRKLTVNGAGDTIVVEGMGREAPILDAFVLKDRTYSGDMEDVIQQALDDQFGTGAIPLSTPVSPSEIVNDTIGDINLMPALSDIAALIGWSLRYQYDASDVLSLTLFEPPRDATDPDWTIADTEYEDLNAEIDISGVRNFIPVTYTDAVDGLQTVISPGAQAGTVSCTSEAATFSTSQAGILEDGAKIVIDRTGLEDYVAFTISAFDGTTGCTLTGAPDFAATQFYTSASITRYGLQTFAMDLSAEPQVSTATAAGNLADAVRADREDPALVQSIKAAGLWFVDLHDYVATSANGVHYSEDQAGGVTSYSHAFADGMLVTTVNLAGKPKGRYTTWKRIGTPGAATTLLPVMESLSLAFEDDGAFGLLDVVFVFGPRANSAKLELDDDPAFGSVWQTVQFDLTVSGTEARQGFGFPDATYRNKRWYARVTPYSGPYSGGVTGRAGLALTANVWAGFQVPTKAQYDTDIGSINTSLASKADISYVDAKVAGLSWKQAVRAATTVAGTLASSFENGDTIDGVTLATGDRILIKNQATASENGIYVVAASGAPSRATDADSGAELVNASCYVSEGTTNADTQWTCTTNATITLGSTSLVFAQLSTGSSSPASTTVAKTTASLANDATETGTITFAKSALLQKIVGSAACWVRLYDTSASRTSDASRAITTSPKAGLGILSNAAPGLDSAGLTIPITPAHELHNGDGPRTSTIYYAITNKSGSTVAITVTFTYLPLES